MPQHEFDDEPELAGYQPHAEAPLRRQRLATVLRIVVIVGLLSLILPGILVTASTANQTANASCARYVTYFAPEAVSFSTRFEFFGPSGPGWNCYAVQFDGAEVLVHALGIIPGGPRLPTAPLQNS